MTNAMRGAFILAILILIALGGGCQHQTVCEKSEQIASCHTWLLGQINRSLPIGRAKDQIKSFCQKEGFYFKEIDGQAYCTWTKEKTISRRSISIWFDLDEKHTLRGYGIHAPEEKYP